ncbi:MAG: ribonuclease P protein component [Oscillospiraceae bacterium]|nr:ribonuclease P protein component [Oscillospiraceae bacterium]
MKHTIILNQNRDFQTLYRRGISFVTPFVVIYIQPNRLGKHRLGITAGKRVGNAVHRNRAKRLIRQAYRELEDELPPYLDLVIVARARIWNVNSTRLVNYLRNNTIPQIQRHWERPIQMLPGGKAEKGENPS